MRILTVKEISIELAKLEGRGKNYEDSYMTALCRKGKIKAHKYDGRYYRVYYDDLLKFHKSRKVYLLEQNGRHLRYFPNYIKY